jgi:hypothetical protein
MSTYPTFSTSNTTYVEPTKCDILCGRGKTYVNHPGNRKFSEVIKSNVHRYVDAQQRMDKIILFACLVEQLQSEGCRFLKQKKGKKGTNQWVEMTTEEAHRKLGHAIRDLVKKNPMKNQLPTAKDTDFSNKLPFENRSNADAHMHDNLTTTATTTTTTSMSMSTTVSPPLSVPTTSDEESNDDCDTISASFPPSRMVRYVSEETNNFGGDKDGVVLATNCYDEDYDDVYNGFVSSLANFYRNRRSFRSCTDFDNLENRYDLANEDSLTNFQF